MAEQSTEQLAKEIQELRQQIEGIRNLLGNILNTQGPNKRQRLIDEITKLLEADVPDDKLQSALDFVAFLASGPGGDEDELIGQEGRL